MIFSSIEFLLYFLPVFFILYGITPSKYKNFTLLIGSLVFYAFGEVGYLIPLMASVLVNYFIGLYLEPVGKKKKKRNGRAEKRNKRRKYILALAIAGNIGALVLCKMDFQGLGMPLGISFYTFQILSYLIDVYRGEVIKERSLVDLATYITMFPQLIAGPIVNYSEVQTALKERTFGAEGIQDGLKLFTMGLAAKVLLADRIGLLWHEAQTTGFESLSRAYAWLAAIAFSLKIYFDFYGYSLMARGLGRMFGFELPENFRTPYMARSVRDFYRRWHITLGRWFCKYVYIPLGGNRKGELRTVGHLFLVWFFTSIWHGTSLNFFLWGGILWLCIVLERQCERRGLFRNFKILPHIYLWAVIPVTWMCFAITDIRELLVYLGRMTGLVEGVSVKSNDWLLALKDYWYLLLCCGLACTSFVQKVYRRAKDTLPGKLVLAVLFWICVRRITVEGNNPFLYLKF